MKRILFLLLLPLFCMSCAETPDGWIVMNEETIENFFEKHKESWAPPMSLNLAHDQEVVSADIPALLPGLVRIEGTLVSAGPYTVPDAPISHRGGTFTKSVFGMFGAVGKNGNAWFYADVDPASGEIRGGRAYLYGFMDGVCDLREKIGPDYGKIMDGKMAFSIAGYCLFPQISGSAAEYALLVEGEFPGYETSASFPVKYIVDDNGAIGNIPNDPEKNSAIFDSGTGSAKILTRP